MKYNFWKDIKVGDLLYYYDTDTWKIGQFLVLNIENGLLYGQGSFIIKTDHNKHKVIYVQTSHFLIDGIVNTWNHSTSNELFININKQELIDDCKSRLKNKIKELKYNMEYYKDLLNNV